MENQGKEMEEQVANNDNDIKQKKIPISIILKTTWKVIEKIILIVVIFISATIVTQNVTRDEQSFLGFRIYSVLTGSMIPKYNIGDVILVKEKEIDEIKVGDDVSYQGMAGAMKGKLVTHRVVEIEEIDGEKVFHTRGIANNADDPVISGDQIYGVVQAKLYTITIISSFLTSLLRNKYAFYFGVIIPLTIFIFFAFLRRNSKKLS